MTGAIGIDCFWSARHLRAAREEPVGRETEAATDEIGLHFPAATG
jgi:hypothetical protein